MEIENNKFSWLITQISGYHSYFHTSVENHLKSLIISIREFLNQKLQLELHPKKLIIRKLSQGIDFVGYVLFSNYTLLRTRTKQRMKKRLKNAYETFLQGKMNAVDLDQRLQSYLGILSHANQQTLSQAVKNAYWVRKETWSD